MGIAAVCLWSVTALLGVVLLGTWIAKGGVRRVSAGHGRHRRLPRSLVLGHPLLAAGGLIVWIGYLVLARSAMSWVAVAVVSGAAALGLVMFVRWVPIYRARAKLGDGPGAAAHRMASPPRTSPEQHFPIAVVVAHGVFAVTTIVLVVLAALDIG